MYTTKTISLALHNKSHRMRQWNALKINNTNEWVAGTHWYCSSATTNTVRKHLHISITPSSKTEPFRNDLYACCKSHGPTHRERKMIICCCFCLRCRCCIEHGEDKLFALFLLWTNIDNCLDRIILPENGQPKDSKRCTKDWVFKQFDVYKFRDSV